MSKIKNNIKAFTMIELLGVVVIIGVLSLLAVSAVTDQVNKSRSKSLVEDARTILSAAKKDYLSPSSSIATGISYVNNKTIYTKDAINELLDKELESPFGGEYKYANVSIEKNTDINGETSYSYEICLIDDDGNGFVYTNPKELKADNVKHNLGTTNCLNE